MNLNPSLNLTERIRPSLELLPAAGTVWVGFSGGLDSTVLLHFLAQQPELRSRIKAIHVHHGLSHNADAWQAHCQEQCQRWQIPLQTETVVLTDLRDGVEQAARSARYGAYKKHAQSGETLLLAQHADDQLETFFMRLLRGSGLSGLTGMAAQRLLGENIQLLRPLLQVQRLQLEQYAQAHQLSWVEDESNQDSRFERNWWRNEILPQLWSRFPKRKATVLRSIQQLQQDQRLLTELLQPKVDSACVSWSWPNCLPHALNLTELAQQPEHYWPYVLRAWLQKNHLMPPSQQWLTQLICDVIHAQSDATPVQILGSWQVQRHKQTLYLIRTAAVQPLASSKSDFRLASQTQLNWAGGLLRTHQATKGLASGQYTLATADAVRQYKLSAENRPTKTVKRWLQEAGIPAPLRANWPVLLQGDTLVAIVGVAQAEHCVVAPGWALSYCIR